MPNHELPGEPPDDPLRDADDDATWLESTWPQLDPALEQGRGMPPTVPREDDR